MLSEAFERYGMSAEVRRGENAVQTKAFVQPLGGVSEQCWRYLGPAEVEIEMGDRVVCGGTQYVVRRAAPFYAGEEIVYYWAILHPEEASA